MPPQATARSPFAGCLILVLALLMLVSLVGFAIWLPFKQASEIEKFTAAAPQPLAVDATEGNEAQVNGLVERLEAFRAELGDEAKPARLELSAADLNLAIAAFPQVAELRKCFRVREIHADALVIDICYQLNGRPRLTRDGEDGFVTADPRYLIGTLRGTPRLGRRELSLAVDSLAVPGATVPDGFMSHFSDLRLFERYLTDPVLGPAMAKLTRAELADGRLVLSRIPGDPLPATAGEASIESGTERLVKWLGIAACVFLAFAATVVFLGIRAQRRKERAAR
jgi:hypothetical protein